MHNLANLHIGGESKIWNKRHLNLKSMAEDGELSEITRLKPTEFTIMGDQVDKRTHTL